MAAGNSKSTRGSRATPTPANRNQQARPGDATGAERDRLQRENAAAQTEAAQRMSLVTSPPVVERPDEVVDYSNGGSPTVGTEPGAVSMDEALADGDTSVGVYDTPLSEIDIDSLPDGTTDLLPEMVERSEEPQSAAGERRDSQQPIPQEQARTDLTKPPVVETRPAPVVEQPYRVLRVNTDLEDVTIGKDNHYTFRVGQPYKVSHEVYQHLFEKGYVLG